MFPHAGHSTLNLAKMQQVQNAQQDAPFVLMLKDLVIDGRIWTRSAVHNAIIIV